MASPGLKLVDASDDDPRCGCPTADGTPCQNWAGGDGTCWIASHTSGEGSADPDLPDPPEHLDDAGRQCWAYYTEKCDELGVLDQIDLTVLEKAAECYEMGKKCWRQAQKGPEIPRGDGTMKRNSAVGKHKEYATEYRQYAKELGRLIAAATPKDRTPDEDDPWDGGW